MKLEWEYSRNQRRHTAYDHKGNERFWIRSEAPYRQHQAHWGYRLMYPDGGHIQFSRIVGLLKSIAQAKAYPPKP